MIVQILLVDALRDRALACVLGLAFGEFLSISAFHSTPGYLSSAFPVGNERIVTWQSVLLACVAGLCRSLRRSALAPARCSLPQPRPERRTIGRQHHNWSTWGRDRPRLLDDHHGGALGHTQSRFIGTAALMIALVCLLPLLFDCLGPSLRPLPGPVPGWPRDSVGCHRAAKSTDTDSFAADRATAAIAVFGTVAIGGAQVNLQHGLQASAAASTQAPTSGSAQESRPACCNDPIPKRSTQAPLRACRASPRLELIVEASSIGESQTMVLAPPSNTKQPIRRAAGRCGNLASPTLRSGKVAGRCSLKRLPPNTIYDVGEPVDRCPRRSHHGCGSRRSAPTWDGRLERSSSTPRDYASLGKRRTERI